MGVGVSYERGTPVASVGACIATVLLTMSISLYRGTSLIRKRPPLGPYNRAMPRALWWS